MATPTLWPVDPNNWHHKTFMQDYFAAPSLIELMRKTPTRTERIAAIDRELGKLKSLGEGGRALIKEQRMLQAGLLDGDALYIPQKGEGKRMLFVVPARRQGKTHTLDAMSYAIEINHQ